MKGIPFLSYIHGILKQMKRLNEVTEDTYDKTTTKKTSALLNLKYLPNAKIDNQIGIGLDFLLFFWREKKRNVVVRIENHCSLGKTDRKVRFCKRLPFPP